MMELYTQVLAGPAEQSAFAVILLTAALLVLGGAWNARRARAVLRIRPRRR